MFFNYTHQSRREKEEEDDDDDETKEGWGGERDNIKIKINLILTKNRLFRSFRSIYFYYKQGLVLVDDAGALAGCCLLPGSV
jgi:hypothetical protein